MSPYVVHRTEAAFGPDANFFRPSRWLDATPAEKVALHSKIITFGWGARVCVGKVRRRLLNASSIPRRAPS